MPLESALSVVALAPAQARALLAEHQAADRMQHAEDRRRSVETMAIADALRAARERPLRYGNAIRRSGLLLPRWYAGVHRLSSPRHSHRHFAEQGIARDLPPNPLFEPAWYRAEYLPPDTNEPPVRHYIRIGARAALRPGPLFDPLSYAARNPDLAQEPDLLAHFLQKGVFEKRDFLPERAAGWTGLRAI